MITARQYAWQILHAKIRYHLTDDEGNEQQQLDNIAHLFKQAQENVSMFDLVLQLAGFGATYAAMPRTGNDPLTVAKQIEQRIMSESDDDDER